MALAIAVGPFVEVSRERLQGVRQRIERVWNERVVPLAERYERERQARRQVRSMICSLALLSCNLYRGVRVCLQTAFLISTCASWLIVDE